MSFKSFAATTAPLKLQIKPKAVPGPSKIRVSYGSSQGSLVFGEFLYFSKGAVWALWNFSTEKGWMPLNEVTFYVDEVQLNRGTLPTEVKSID